MIALLLSRKIKTQTHSGVRQMFGLHFVKTDLIDRNLDKFYTYIHDKRQTGDYDDFVKYKEEDVLNLLPSAKNLIENIETLLKS